MNGGQQIVLKINNKNQENIIAGAASGLSSRGVRLALFPELSVTGYTCGDLFHNSTLLDETESALHALADMSASRVCIIKMEWKNLVKSRKITYFAL